MKKRIILLVLALLLLTGCHRASQEAATPTDTTLPVQEAPAYPQAPPAQSFQEPEIRISLEEVAGQGRYRVIISDAPGLSSFTLYYEDGILSTVVTAFRSAAGAAPAVSQASGANLEDFHYKAIRFLDYTPQALADRLAQEGFTHASVTPIQ